MHICILNMPAEYYSPVCGGAVATVIRETTQALLAREHEVAVVTIVNQDPTYQVGRVLPLAARHRGNLSFVQRRWSDLRRKVQHWDWPYYEYYLHAVEKTLRQMQPTPDVVIVHNDLVAPRFIKKILPQTKVIVWLHNENRTAECHLLANKKAVDHYIAVSGYIRDWTIKNHQIPPEKITTVLNAVNPESFYPRPDWLQTREPVRVLFASRIDRNKGPDLAADAVTALRAEGLSVQLTVAGGLWWYSQGKENTDPFLKELRGKMEQAQAQYLGHVTREKIPELYRQHDIVCLLSRSEDPCPLVCLEALGSGCALLASPRGGIPEVCAGAALLADPNNLAEVTTALRRLVTDPRELLRWKRAGHQRATERPWSCVAQEVEALCESHVSGRALTPAVAVN